MDVTYIQTLQQALLLAKNPEDKAALIAEASLTTLSNEVARVARQCVLFHWFNQSIVEGLLLAVPLHKKSVQELYRQITSLPFVEQLQWGAVYQDLTRQGLLKHYADTQPELLRTAARLAAPLYQASKEDERSITEALFCSMISGDASASVAKLSILLEYAMSRQDWQQMENLLRLQEEAEQLSLVDPLPRTEQFWMLRSIVNRIRGKLDEAISDYAHALAQNPNNVLAYISRSILYTQQQRHEQARADYREAFQRDPNLVQVYVKRGIISPPANLMMAIPTDSTLKSQIFQLSEGFLSIQMKAQLTTFRTLWKRLETLPLETLSKGFGQQPSPATGLGFGESQSVLPVVSVISWALLHQPTLKTHPPDKLQLLILNEAQARGCSRALSSALARYLQPRLSGS